MEFLSGPYLLIVNPAARRAARMVSIARRVFESAGAAVEEVWTERSGHAAEIASARAGSVGAVVVLGGDGTLKEVAGALAHSGRPVGILPGGTGNLVARSLGIPMEADRAARVVLEGMTVATDLGLVRVPRIVTAHAVGRILNAKTARSQIISGAVWGVGMALEEETLIDPRTGRYVNADLAEYHVPVNADIGTIDAAFIEEPDEHVSTVGAKGIGEIGITGVAASIANAVYHATGKRVRELPIRIERILAEAP